MAVDPIRSALNTPIGQLSQGAFNSRLENRIDEVKHGDYLTPSSVDYELAEKNASVSVTLSQTNPKAAALYAGFSSLFRYDRAARFVNNVEYATRVQSQVQSKDEVKAEVDKIFAAYKDDGATKDGVEDTQSDSSSAASSETPVHFTTIQDEILAPKVDADASIGTPSR